MNNYLKITLTNLFLSIFTLISCTNSPQTFTISGTLETDDIDLTAPFSAELLDIRYPEGATISPGDTLAVLDTILVVAALDAAKAAVEEASSNLADLQAGSDKEKILAAEARFKQSKATAKQATVDLKRSTKLHQQKLLDDRSLEQAQLLSANSEQAVTVAKQVLADLTRGARANQISAAQSSLRRVKAEFNARAKNYSDAFIIAKHTGVVQILPYQIGERVPLGQTIISLRNPENMWVMIFVPENKLDAVAIGGSLTFSVDAYPGCSFSGNVVFISDEAEFTPRNVQSPEERINLVFAVKVVVSSNPKELKAGMPADFVLQ